MKFRRKQRADSTINLTPLIDVVFLLLIFFMVTTTFTRENRLSIQLPEAGGDQLDMEEKTLELLVSRDGSYALNGVNLINRELTTIMAALEQASGGDNSTAVTITADAQASHQSVVRAMDAAGRKGFLQLNITTQMAEDQAVNDSTDK